MTPFPWGEAMRFGFGVLKLDSRSFWALTPRELAAAWGAVIGSGAALARSELSQMMERYPDGQ